MELPVRDSALGRDTAKPGTRPSRIIQTTTGLRELDHRTNNRVDVWLLWREHDDQLVVAVAEGNTGDCFSIEIRDGERALDVFRHPYAYAAWRGVETRAA
jgi:hypothetical protein